MPSTLRCIEGVQEYFRRDPTSRHHITSLTVTLSALRLFVNTNPYEFRNYVITLKFHLPCAILLSMEMQSASTALWPLVVYFFSAVVLVAVMIALSYVLGERHREKQTAEPYESGIVSTGTARVRFDIKFYLVAMFFVIFDLEAVFIYAWAVSIRETGWSGYGEMLIFIGVLAAALIYLWRLGALEWGAFVKKAQIVR